MQLIPNYFEFTIEYLEPDHIQQILVGKQIKPTDFLEPSNIIQGPQNSTYSSSKENCVVGNDKKNIDSRNKQQHQLLVENIAKEEKNGSSNFKQIKLSEKPTSFKVKRERFLSEDNYHPTYQIINFQNLLFQDDYFSNQNSIQQQQKTLNNYHHCNSTINKYVHFFNTEPKNKNFFSNSNNNNKILEESLNNNILKGYINNMNNTAKYEKETASRKSTDMKSQLKSKNLDFLPEEEASDVSFDLNIDDCDGISEENSEKECYEDAESDNTFQRTRQKEINKFSLDEVVSKAKVLKEVLSIKNNPQTPANNY